MVIQEHIHQMRVATISGYNQKFNCWGATQYALGQRKRWGWVGMDVMWRWLNKKTEVISTEPQVGDILVISCSHYNHLIHTAVYVGEGKWFHKRGKFDTITHTQKEVEDCYITPVFFWGEMKPKVTINRLKKK